MSQLQNVRGTHDLLPEDCLKQRYITHRAREVALTYGFKEVATPIFEFTSVFKRTLGEASDIVSKEMYTFEDRGGDSLTLRPEGTAPIARAVISHGLGRQAPLKYFYQGPMFRYERPQKGRQRQFHQFGAELIGVDGPQADIEVISLAYNTLKALDLLDDTVLEINSLGDEESRNSYRASLVKYLNANKAQLSEDSQKRLETNPLRILDSKDKSDKELLEKAPVLEEFLNDFSKSHYREICEALESLEIPYKKNQKLVRGLDYYSHCVFEFKSSSLGAQDAVLSGGRYDKLIKQMGGPQLSGVGFGAGIERLAMLLKQEIPTPRPVALIPIGDDAEKEALKMAHNLRSQGYAVELSYSGNLSKRMKKANRANAIAAFVFGDDELKNKELKYKDLKTGDQESISINNLVQKIETIIQS